ncbi:MAG: hypothetical protein QE271_01090 [Bacteriovoracaceae bacterium]|nr:hypothetical protein [Bacteriovoracaceae bacterium]
MFNTDVRWGQVFFLLFFPFTWIQAQQNTESTEVIGWYPNSGVSLGKGVSKSFPLKEYQSCVSYNPKTIHPLDANNSVNTKMKISLVTNTKEMHKALGISGRIGANLAFISKLPLGDIGAQFGTEKSQDISDSSIALVISAEADYGRYELEPVDNEEGLILKAKFKQLIDQGNYKNFMQQCGTHFVIRERRRGAVHAIIKVSDLTKSKKRKLQASLQLGNTNEPDAEVDPNNIYPASKPAFQGSSSVKIPASVSLGIDNFLKEAKESDGTVEIEFTTDGGGGLENQTDLFEEGKITFEGLLKTTAKYLSSFSRVNLPEQNETTNYANLPGAPYQYHIVPYSLLGVNLNYSNVNYSQLEELYYLMIGAYSNKEILKTIIEDLTPTESPESFQYVSKKITEISTYMTKINALADKIISGKSIEPSEIPTLPPVDLATVLPQATLLQSDFLCEVSGENASCGKSASGWSSQKWTAYVKIAGKISNAFQAKSVNIYKVTNGMRGNPIYTIVKSSETGFMYFRSSGEFSIAFNKMQQGKDEALYQQYRSAMPNYEVTIIDVNGKSMDTKEINLALRGPHSQLKRTPN